MLRMFKLEASKLRIDMTRYFIMHCSILSWIDEIAVSISWSRDQCITRFRCEFKSMQKSAENGNSAVKMELLVQSGFVIRDDRYPMDDKQSTLEREIYRINTQGPLCIGAYLYY